GRDYHRRETSNQEAPGCPTSTHAVLIGTLRRSLNHCNARLPSGLSDEALAHQRLDLRDDLRVAMLEALELRPEHDVDRRRRGWRDGCGSSAGAEERHLSEAVARAEGCDLVGTRRNARLSVGQGEKGVAARSFVDQLGLGAGRLHFEPLGEL